MIYRALNSVLELPQTRSKGSPVPGALDAFRVDYAGNRSHGRIDSIVDHDVRIQIYRFQLVFGTSQSSNERFGIFRPSCREALYQSLCRRRKAENEERLRKWGGKLFGTLRVDVHDHVLPLR